MYVSVRKLSKYNTGRSSHNYWVKENTAKLITGAWWLNQNASQLLCKGWVTFNGITPHSCAHACTQGCCVTRNVMAQHVRDISDTHSDNESTLNTKFAASGFTFL